MLSRIFGTPKEKPKPKKPRKLKFKQGDMVIIIIGKVKAMVTRVFPHDNDYHLDYLVEYWDYMTNSPIRLYCREFELKPVRKVKT